MVLKEISDGENIILDMIVNNIGDPSKKVDVKMKRNLTIRSRVSDPLDNNINASQSKAPCKDRFC